MDHNELEEKAHDETVGPKNTDHMISYLVHHIMESFPSWVSTVHTYSLIMLVAQINCYMMSEAMELVQQQILDYVRVSSMIAGHTNFGPDKLFSKVTTTYARSDVFTTQELVAVASTYSTVVHDEGDIVKTWRDKLGRSTPKFLVFKHLMIF